MTDDIPLPIKNFSAQHPGFPEGGMRHIIFHHGDELVQCGAVIRVGRKILIDPPRFLDWIRARSLRSASAA